MGQCSSIPSGELLSDPNQILSDEVSSRRDLSFLKVHRPDPARRSLLDPEEVFRVLRHQAEERSRQEAEAAAEQACYRDLPLQPKLSFEGSSVFSPESSTVAPTEVTTGTAATRPTSNLDRYARKKQSRSISVMDSIREHSGAAHRWTQRAEFQRQQKTTIPTAWVLGPRLGQPEHSWPNAPEEQSPLGLGAAVACFGAPQQSNFQQFMSVLHLKMKSNMMDYYQNSFAPLFPEYPVPWLGALSYRESTPTLVRSNSDSSSSEEIEFGEGPPSSPIRLAVDHSSFMDLGFAGSLGMLESEQTMVVASPNARKSPEHYLILLNRRSGIPLAVCALKANVGPPIVRIYATKARAFGQRSPAATHQLGLNWTASYPLFSWAEIVAEGDEPMPRKYSIYMASGSDGRFEEYPSYVAHHDSALSPDIRVMGRTEADLSHQGCAFISCKATDVGEEPSLQVHISQGIDPSLMLCFAAVVDQVIARYLRQQCELKKEELQGARRHDHFHYGGFG